MKNNQKIPEGWSVKKLGELGSFSKGSGITKNDLVSEGIPCVRYAELYTKYNFVISNCISFVSEEVSKTAKPIKYGDILFAGSGETKEEIGKCAAYISRIPAYAGGDNIILRPFQDNSIFLSYFLNTVGRRYLNRLGQGDSIVHIHAENLKKVYIPIPPLPEQEKIAGILGTWDEAIEKLSSLIEQKKLLKKGLMQRLLTGKTRLKGFTQPWKEVKLGEVLFEHSQKSCENEAVCSVSVHKGVVNQVEHLGRSFSAANTSNYNLVHYGDVIYTKSPTGDFPYGIFKQSQQKSNVIVSPLYGVFTPKSYALGYILDSYFSYPVNMNNYLKPIIQKGAKNTINITNKTFLSKSLCLPTNINEQQAIADVLSTADEEIDLLNKKLEALKEQKKGLMQQLLTGQTRVKVN